MTGPVPNDLAAAMLSEARAEVQLADAKASILFAGLGVGFGAVIGVLLARDWSPFDLTGIGPLLWWIGVIAAVASVISAAAAVWPRYSKKHQPRKIAYWGHVADYKTFSEFAAALDATDSTPHDRVRHQLWHISRIVARKYTAIRAAIVFSGAGAALIALGSILGG